MRIKKYYVVSVILLLFVVSTSIRGNKIYAEQYESTEYENNYEIKASVVENSINKTQEAEPKDYKFNKKDLYKKLEGYNYCVIKQSVENRCISELSYSKAVNYKVTVDTQNGTNKLKSDGKNYFSNYKAKRFYKRSRGKWVEQKKRGVALDWDFSKFKSLEDVFKALVNDYTVKDETVGCEIDDFIYYTNIRDAKKSDISGVNYDKLLTRETTYIVDKKTGLPKSVQVIVEYEYKDCLYEVASVIQFDNYSKKKELKLE